MPSYVMSQVPVLSILLSQETVPGKPVHGSYVTRPDSQTSTTLAGRSVSLYDTGFDHVYFYVAYAADVILTAKAVTTPVDDDADDDMSF